MIVVLILSIVVFSFGVTMVFKFFQWGSEKTEEIDTETERQIMEAMRGGNDVVALSKKSTDTKPGIKTTIGLGINNILDTSKFTARITFDEAYAPDDKTLLQVNKAETERKWLGSFRQQEPIQIEKDKFVAIPITINAASSDKGTYVFNACVFKEPQQPTNCLLENKETTYDKKIHQISIRII